MAHAQVVVCSFYTDDDYYRASAARLAADLDRLGISHVIEQVVTEPGDEWPDICRRKIPFIARICAENPDARVFWVDVDCSIRSLPRMIREFSADFIGFQRGFASPMSIGYRSRTRFWEPCFYGVNATASGRALIAEAARLEAALTVRATDDYFLEEAWRSLAAGLSFQVIPSNHAARGAVDDPEAFFVFGSSGKVSHYRGHVEQHTKPGPARARLKGRARREARDLAKRVEAALPNSAARKLRTFADRTGATSKLVTSEIGTSPVRQSQVAEMLRAAKTGDAQTMDRAADALTAAGRVSVAEQAAIDAAVAFHHYAASDFNNEPPLSLTWWAMPYPGNFGDWLSPFVVRAHTGRPVIFQPPAAYASQPHLVGIGSIGRFIKPNSIVVGTGIASPDTELTRKARYVSVRGPLTAQALAAQGGPTVESFGDPGLLLSRVLPIHRGTTNGRIALVRHTTHRKAPVRLRDDMDELSVLMSHPDSIREFVSLLATYDAVVTSAMHVMIACHSYGIPCALVTFEGLESSVPGSGMKYADYALGAGLDAVASPAVAPLNLERAPIEDLVRHVVVDPSKLDEVESALRVGLAELTPAVPR